MRARLEALSDRLRRETGVNVDILQADLTDDVELARVESQVRIEPRYPSPIHS